ncbi:carboxylesterase family protein [Dactylosporangium sp. NPDC000244]|uniref:carboxylesterase/lipase family protein n=1 Tax=Dactylosporangium sp. NPDC000244 TaxID=3154365 RepID=UPI003333726B
MRWSWKRSAAAVLAAGLVGTLGAAQASASPGHDPIARTWGGWVRGAVVDGTEQYLGIPFAAPPTGALRWQAPRPATPWTGVRDATALGPICPQTPAVLNSGLGSTTEDCLRVNVYRPAKPQRRPLPVIVWLHGPSDSGSGNSYRPGPLAAAGDAVVVTVNYRLGIFGFLAHPGLSAEAGAAGSGNYGLLDQQAALRWTQRNIAAFGGDPRRVAVAGQSDGGTDVCAHVASPAAAGLFQRAVVQSGLCGLPLPTLAQSEQRGVALAQSAGCTTVACLRGLPVADVLRLGTTGAWGPSVGGSVLPRQIPQAFATGAVHRVPVIQGTTHDEGRFLIATELAGRPPLTAEDYQHEITARFGDRSAQVLAEYPAQAYDVPELALSAVVTDSTFACPTRALNTALNRHVPVYEYEFDDPDAPLFLPVPHTFPLGAYHAVEVQYQFAFPIPMPPLSDAQRALAERMGRYWLAFAATGDPNTAGAPSWSRFRGADAQIQSLAPAGPARADDFGTDHRCGFWSGLQAG